MILKGDERVVKREPLEHSTSVGNVDYASRLSRLLTF